VLLYIATPNAIVFLYSHVYPEISALKCFFTCCVIITVGVNFNAAIYDRFTNAALADLGNAFQLLFEYAKWSDDNIISVFDETIGL